MPPDRRACRSAFQPVPIVLWSSLFGGGKYLKSLLFGIE
jgi:hypothetical protein